MHVQFEITAVTQDALQTHISNAAWSLNDFLFKGRLTRSEHICIRLKDKTSVVFRIWYEGINCKFCSPNFDELTECY